MALAVSSRADAPAEAVVGLGEALRARDVDVTALEDPVALVFSSAHHAEDPVALSGALKDLLGPVPFLGWVGTSAMEGLRLAEGEPGLALLLLERSGAYIRTAGPAPLGSHVAAALLADAPLGRTRLLSAPPEGFDAANLLPCFDEQTVPLAGALNASAASPASALARDLSAPATSGLCVLEGYDVVLGVAQGARALGPARQVSRADEHLVHELDGRPALQVLLEDLPPALRGDLGRLQGALLAGLAAPLDVDDGGAHVLRHIVGIDPRTGSLAVAERVERGTELSFHVRDGQAAREDLERTLHAMSEGLGEERPEAVLLFDCAGRNQALLGVGEHDVGRVDDILGHGKIPVVGIHGNGELATVGPRSHLFSYTAVIAALLPAT